jgi:RNA polymerase sigma-70 factor (family 1)
LPDFFNFMIACCAALKKYTRYTPKELLDLIVQDNEAAFSELYERYWEKLFVIAFNRLRDKAAAEDIVHDVFTALWTNRHTHPVIAPENYLAVAVKYAVLNRVKQQIREREKRARSAEAAPVSECRIETALHYKTIIERVKLEVEHLPVRCRLIFQYSREEGLPVKEIARRLRISPKTVENQLGKAVRQLKLAARSLLHSLF